MNFKNLVVASTILLMLGGPTTAATRQVGLPGYLPDAEPLTGTTPQQVFASVRDRPDARIKLSTEAGVATVEFIDDRTHNTYIFFGKGHWAYPSVMRVRRVEQDGLWATRVAYLCGAEERACKRFKKKLEARDPQIAFVDASLAEQEPVKRLLQPLPESPKGYPLPDPDFWITRYGPNPDGSEYRWQKDIPLESAIDPCQIAYPLYGAPPDYPTEEAFSGIGGSVVLLMIVDGTGRVVDAKIERSSHNRNLDAAALNAVSIYRFKMKGCASDKSLTPVRLPFNFSPIADLAHGSWQYFDAKKFGY